MNIPDTVPTVIVPASTGLSLGVKFTLIPELSFLPVVKGTVHRITQINVQAS